MDFSKAFDKVDHQRLRLKLRRLGINTTVIAWIKSFLSCRSQSVVLDSKQSGVCLVLSRVPQGTMLGPCLFIMYINDMPDSIKSNIGLCADDTIMYLTITYHSDCQSNKVAKIRNRYNQVPHLTQDTNGKVTNSKKTPQTRAKRSALSQQVTTKHI